MKSLLSFILYFTLCYTLVFPSCGKDNGDKSCETVVNPNGPAFLKVINDRDDEIFVDLTSIIPLGAQTRPGACEIFGLPTGDHTITIENESGTASKDVDISLSDGETYTLTVGAGFF
jgi:hypothetical protein